MSLSHFPPVDGLESCNGISQRLMSQLATSAQVLISSPVVATITGELQSNVTIVITPSTGGQVSGLLAIQDPSMSGHPIEL
jgi:hypothetical protein